MANNTSQYVKGGSPVADFSKVGQIGLSFYAAQAARQDAEHKSLIDAVAASDVALADSKKYIMSLPPEVAAIYSKKVSEGLASRSEQIMQGGSAVSMGSSTQEFQDIAMSAAKISTISTDLTNKYEAMRRQEDYLENKEVYDEWYNNSSQKILDISKGGIEDVAAMEFFQPPIKVMDTNIVEQSIGAYNAFLPPEKFTSTNRKTGSSRFLMDDARAFSMEFVQDSYERNKGDQSIIDVLSVTSMSPGLTPEETNNEVVKYRGIVNQLSEGGIETKEQIEAINGITSDKRMELNTGLQFLAAREVQMKGWADKLLSTIETSNVQGTSSEGGLDLSDYPGSAGVLSIDSLNIAPEAAKKLGLDANGIYGASGTKGRSHRIGQGVTTIHIDGIIYDGKNYYGNAQVLSPTFMEQYLAGHRSQSDLNDALASGGQFVPEIVSMSRIGLDIPTKDLRAMKAVAKIEYDNAKRYEELDSIGSQEPMAQSTDNLLGVSVRPQPFNK